MSRSRGVANRTLPAVAGLLLLAGGLLLLGLGDAGWLDRGLPAAWRARGWWTPAVTGALALGFVLLCAWFLGQLRRRGLRGLPLAGPRVTLAAGAVDEALAARVRALPDVTRARVRLTGSPRRPRGRVNVTLRPGSRPVDVLSDIERILAEARLAAAPHPLGADVHPRAAAGDRGQRLD